MSPKFPPKRVFISYSHKDDPFLEQLREQFAPMENEGLIATFIDRAIEGGEEWDDEIRKELDAADIILMLVSPSFLASKYCWTIEMVRAMERHEAGTARVIPIILRKGDEWKRAPFAKLKAYPEDAKPITSFADPDEGWASVVRGIRRVVENMNAKAQPPKPG